MEDLVVYFDYAMNEQCHEFEECDNDPEAFEQLCQDAKERNFRTNVMPLELDGSFVKSCDYGSY